MLSLLLSQFHEAYCKLGEMQSPSSQKEHTSSVSAVGRAGGDSHSFAGTSGVAELGSEEKSMWVSVLRSDSGQRQTLRKRL